MILGYLFFYALVVSTLAVGIDRAISGLIFQCQSCKRDRINRHHCRHCGVLGNEAPEPVRPRRSSRVRFH